jgi:hypothetical protein
MKSFLYFFLFSLFLFGMGVWVVLNKERKKIDGFCVKSGRGEELRRIYGSY